MTHKIYKMHQGFEYWIGFTPHSTNATVEISFPEIWDIGALLSQEIVENIKKMAWSSKNVGATEWHYITTTDRARIIWKTLIVHGDFKEQKRNG